MKETKKKKTYAPPVLTTVAFRAEQGYWESFNTDASGGGLLGSAFSSGDADPWDGTPGDEGSTFGNGWTNNENDPWN